MVVFLWCCFCGGVFVVVFLWWCLCGGVVVFFWCFCGGVVVVFLWWCFCGGVFVVLFLWWCFCDGVFVVLFLWWCFCGGFVVFLCVVVFLRWCFCVFDISLRKLSEAMHINLQHEKGDRKNSDELVEALVSALLSEVPVLANFHASFVEASLKDLRQVRDGLSGQAEQRGELHKRLWKLTIKDKRDHVVTLRDLSRSLELPVGRGMSKDEYVEQILTALLAEAPATASVDDAKTALVDASLRELLALRDGLAGQASQRQELESKLWQFNVRNRSSDVVTLRDLSGSLGLATNHAGRYFSQAVLVQQIVEFLLRGSLDAGKKASVDATSSSASTG